MELIEKTRVDFVCYTFFIKRHFKKRFRDSYVQNFVGQIFNQYVQKFIRNFNFKIPVNDEVFWERFNFNSLTSIVFIYFFLHI